MGDLAYEQARICDGRPAADSELTEEYNPLEAGLQSAISLTKVNSLPHVGHILCLGVHDLCTVYQRLISFRAESPSQSSITERMCETLTVWTPSRHPLNGLVAGMLRWG